MHNITDYTDAAIDLETLDTSPRALILSIGVVLFNRHNITIQPAALEIPVRSLGQRRKISLSTLIWWRGQSEEARKAIKDTRRTAVSLSKALAQMTSFLEGFKDVRVWGNGASFDNAILADAYKNNVHKEIPWAFWNDRCLRTLLGEVEELTGRSLKEEVPFVGERHGALADALHQAKLVQEATYVLTNLLY